VETCPHSKTIRGQVKTEQLRVVLGPWPLCPGRSSFVESALCFGGGGVWVKERLCPP